MPLRTPPSWLQNGSHPAENDRLSAQALYFTTGVAHASSLIVAAQGTPNMSVTVASGWAAIVSSTANAGTYLAFNDASTTLTITTADATNPRIDRVVITVNDSFYSGASNNVIFQVIAGTPAVSPVAPATPSNSISLATIAVAAGTTAIQPANITDTRVIASTNLPALRNSALSTSILTGGAFEYDGNVSYFTPSSAATLLTNGGRGVNVVSMVNQRQTDTALTAGSTAAQSLFATNSLQLAANTTYLVELVARIQITTSSITSNTFQIAFPNPTSFKGYLLGGVDGTTAPTLKLFSGTPLAATFFTSTTAANNTFDILVKGHVTVTTNTTLQPNLICSASNTSSIQVLGGSFITATPVGSNTVGAVGAWQ